MTRNRPLAIALRHVAFEDLGLLGPILARAGWDVRYLDAPVDALTAEADLLIVLGGPIGACEAEAYPFLAAETEPLERRLVRGRPTLGICLGCQLMAQALGARVFPGSIKEIGWGPVTLTPAGLTSELSVLVDSKARVLHWHGDTFDLPAGAVPLASNANYENQAFAFGSAALALQFHVEADPATLELWYVGHAAELSAAGVSVPKLRAASAAVAPRARAQAETIFVPGLARIADEQ